MQLTTEMRAEVLTFQKRVDQILKAVMPMSMEIAGKWIPSRNVESIRGFIAELDHFKVRLENIICETDIKEQAHLQTVIYTVNFTL